MTDPDPSDRDLVLRTLEGEREAFGELVRRYLRKAMAVAWEYTELREDAEDVVQEAFGKALRGLAGFDPVRPFAPWLYAIVRNTAHNTTSARSRWKLVAVPDSLPDREDTPLDDAARAQLRARIERALETLSPMQRRCFRLCELEGFTSVEAGEALGVTEETVRTHLFRARKGLKQSLQSLRGEGRMA